MVWRLLCATKRRYDNHMYRQTCDNKITFINEHVMYMMLKISCGFMLDIKYL